MPTTRYTYLLIAAAIVMLSAAPTEACTCMTPRRIVAIGKADCIFSGTLIKAVDPRGVQGSAGTTGFGEMVDP